MRRLMVVIVVVALWAGPGSGLAAEESPSTGAFSPAGTALGGARVSHTATTLSDGRVLVVGGVGFSGGDPALLASAEIWDPASGTFSPAGSLAEAREWHTATLLLDGRVLVVGGRGIGDRVIDGTGSRVSAEIWDPASGTFSPAGSLAEAREWHTATLLLDGRVLVIGGQDVGDDGAVDHASAEFWDPTTEEFGPAGSLAEARYQHTATLLPDGRVLVIGGHGSHTLASAELWDSATGTFGSSGSLTEPRASHTATLLLDGRVLVVGGWDPAESSPDAAEVWDPAAGMFSPAGSLAEARQGHAATLLPDGRVLVIGGYVVGHEPLDQAEVWDPGPGTFSPAGLLTEARTFHAATPLLDGRVLVVAGWAGGDVYLDSAEVWDSSDG